MRKNISFSILGLLFLLNILAWLALFDLNKLKFLEVNFFDVGQGDAIFIETPRGQQILIDGGPDPTVLERLSQEMPFWDRDIDLIILTHPEADHLSGLLEVLKRYKIENILWTGVVRDIAEYKEWEKLIQKEKAKIKIAQAGQKVICSISNLEHCYFIILSPLENLEGQEFKDSNNTSIITKLVFGENSFLFTGDIYKSGELQLTNQEINVDSDILKVSHHGSKTSSSEEFLEKVSPEIGVISVGKNRYGHPHQETLETLQKYGIKVLRTDLNGNIKIFSDGKKLKLDL